MAGHEQMRVKARTRIASMFLAFAMVVNLLPSSAFAEDEPATVADTSAVYVSSSGNDTSGDGSETNPYATISKAYTAVADGGTICLLSDVDVSAQITFGTAKTVTITSADSNNVKTIYSKIAFGYDNKTMMTVTAGEVVFKHITIDGTGQRQAAKTGFPNGVANSPGCIYATKSGATATLDAGTTIQNFWKNNGTSGGSSVLKSTISGAQINIKDGVLITGCVLEAGNTSDPSSVISSGTGAIVCMTGGKVTGNTLSTTESASTAIVNIGMISNPHFWMTGGVITGNTINNGCAAVYMRGEANACDIQFGDTAYVYGNYVSGTDGDQRNIYLKNNKDGNENDNVFVKLCSALTGDAKLGVYAEMIGMGTKVAQGTSESGTGADSTPTGSTYTATIADTAYFVSDKATAAEILYCGGSEDTCGLLTHSSASPNHEKAIYLSISPTVSASKGTTAGTIDATISRCASDATYVVLDKDMKPVTGKELTGGEYGTDGKGTFTLSDTDTTTTIGVQGLPKDSGPYTVMLVGADGLSVDSTTGKASTDNLTDIATINVVNFAGEGVTWSDGTTSFGNGDFDIVTVPHNDQTGKATKTYTATAKNGYALAAENAVSASGNLNTATVTDNTDGSKAIAVEVPAYSTTSKGTTSYNTVTLAGTTVINTGVKLLDKTDGEEMADGKTYDGVAVAHTDASIDGATLSYTWQKKSAEGADYTDTTDNAAPSDAGDYNLKITMTKTDGTESGTQNLPFTISKKPLTVTATVNDKTYDGGTDATLKSAALDGVLEEDATAVSLDHSKIAVTFTDKNAGDSKTVTVTVTDSALSGGKARNYTITTATAANAKISPKTVTATITADNKIYDGTATATVSTPALDGVETGDNVSAEASNAVFVGGSSVDNNKTVTVDIALTGDDAGNYTLTKTTASATANITAKELGVIVTAESKTYDGTTDATATVTLKTDDVVEGDNVSLDDNNMKAKFDTATVGDGKTVTVTGLKLDGDAAKNYKLPSNITGTANITKADSGVGTVTMESWTYGDEAKTPVATSTTNPETDTNKISYRYKVKDADDDTYTDTKPTNAGEYTVQATFPANDNYATATATANFTISPKALTVKVAAADKVYDGTTDAKLNTATLVGVEEADEEKVTLVADGVSATFNNENVGTDKTVVLSGSYTLTGDSAKNYTVTQPTGLKADITAAPLTITGATVTPKTYDGTDSATVTAVTFDGLKNGETLTLNDDYTIYNAKYDNVNATGTSAATKVDFNVVLNTTDVTKNYTLKTTAGSQEATIGKASHDNSTLSTKGNRGDTNALSGISAYVVAGGTVGTITTEGDDIFDSTPAYDSSTGALSYTLKTTATESQTATVTLPVTSTNYNDYTIVVTVSVTPKETVEISIDGENYTYDGNTHAPTGITVAGNKVLITDLEVTYEGAEGTSYGPSETAPTNAGKYIMTVKVPESNTKYIGSATCDFDIAKKPITATITAEDKVYDGNATAKVAAALDGVVESDRDKVTAVVTNPAFADKNVGENKKVTASISLEGTAAGNYTVNDTAETTASISIKEVSIIDVTVEASKTYDKTTIAAITNNGTISGKVSMDDLTISVGTASYDNAKVGTNKDVTFTGFALTGKDVDNYKLTEQPASVKADITAKEVTISGVTVVDSKTYDGNTNAEIKNSGELTGVEDGDTVTITTGTATYNDKKAGDNKTVTFSSFGLEGTDASNYTLKEQPAATAAAITQREVTISGLTATKVYDGNKTAEKSEISGTVVVGNKAVESDDISVSTESMAGEFNSKNVAEATTVTISGLSLTGDDAANYKLPETITCTADITAKEVTASITAKSKTFDGSTAAEATVTLSGTVDGDNVSAKITGAEFANANVAVGKQVTATIALDGDDATNYTVNETATATANITAQALTLTIKANNKKLDGSNVAVLDTENATLDGMISGHLVSVGSAQGTFENYNTASDTAVVNVADIKLKGEDASNYEITKINSVTAQLIPLYVTFVDGDAKLGEKTISVYNTAPADVIAPEKSGYNFAGWYTDEACITPWNSKTGITTDTTVYAQWSTNTLYTLSGVVEQDNAAQSNVVVTLYEGSVGIAATTTDSNGRYSFGNVPNGRYTITAKASDRAATKTVTIQDGNMTQDIVLPATAVATEVQVAPGAPAVTVSGIDEALVNALIASDRNDVTAPQDGERLEVKLNVKADASPDEKAAIQKTESENTSWDFVNMDVDWSKYKLNDHIGSGNIADTVKVLAIRVPYEMNSKRDIVIYRHHMNEDTAEVARFTQLQSEPSEANYTDGTCYVGDDYIMLYTQKFSAFGIGYIADTTNPVISGAENGKTYCNPVTLTITDEEIEQVTVNGEKVSLDAKGQLTLNAADGEQTVVAVDAARNSSSMTVTVNNGHTYGDWTSNGNGTHSRICSVDAHVETQNCSGGTATCSAVAICMVCGGDYGELDPQNHVDLKHVDAKAATANTEGNTEYWYCDGCGKYYKDARATTEITKADTVTATLKSVSTRETAVKTGDESALFLWIALLLVSGGAVVITTLVVRKKKHNK